MAKDSPDALAAALGSRCTACVIVIDMPVLSGRLGSAACSAAALSREHRVELSRRDPVPLAKAAVASDCRIFARTVTAIRVDVGLVRVARVALLAPMTTKVLEGPVDLAASANLAPVSHR